MSKVIRQIRRFITKDVQNESESKDLAVMLRSLTILSIIYLLFSSIYLAHIGLYFLAVFSMIPIGIYIASFIQSYENKTKLSYLLFVYTSIGVSVIYTLTAGWDKNFQWIACICALVIFYPVGIETKLKVKRVEMLLIFAAILVVLSHFFGNSKNGNEFITLIYKIICVEFYCGCISIIAFCYSKKYNASELKLRNYNIKLQQMASLDALTHLMNRRSMNEYLSQLVYTKEKKGDIFSIAIADLDFFKKINDNYGHDAGDYVLTEVSEIFSKTMEGRGKVARWGGEEFLFCFEDLNVSQAFNVLDEMRAKIENFNFNFKDKPINVTITIGLEEYYHITGIEGTISKADQKLYEGKTSGRNRVIL